MSPITTSKNSVTGTNTLASRAKAAIELMGSALLTQHPNPCQVDLNRLYFELRIVLQRILILDRVGRLDEVLAADGWTATLDLDLESELFLMEHDDQKCAQKNSDRIWSHEWVKLLHRDYQECPGNWFGEAVGIVRGDAREMGAVDESLMGWVPKRTDTGGLELVGEDGSERKLGGVFYTPAPVVGYVLDRALSPAIDACGADVEKLLKLRVCDPACGCGYFLIDAARRIGDRIREVAGGDPDGNPMGEVVSRCVMGGDVNPVTAEVCRWALWFEGGNKSVTIESLRSQIRCGDSLVDDVFAGGSFDVVVGNPPFLNQLGSGTARSVDRVRVLRDRGLVGGAAYTDEASAFFVLGLGLARDGGRVCMVQPQSVLATRGGAWMRSRSGEVGRLESLWVSNAHVFGDASVYTCAPCVVVLGDRDAQACDTLLIDRSSGVGFDGHRSMEIGRDAFGVLETWSSVAAVTMGTPEVSFESSGVVGDAATATADFRDEYYGLAGKLVEDGECGDGDGSVRAVTTGLVDLGVCRWGARATRILKRRWESPRVSGDAVDSDERLARWVAARRVEKVLVATQTRVVEAFVDDGGGFVAVTPMISVMVKDFEDTACRRRSSRGTRTESGSGLDTAIDVWKLGAAIGSPVCSAFAMQQYGGAAMHADALKMSARQVMGLPLPADGGAWAEGARAFERVHAAARAGDGYGAALVEFGMVMCGAYGVRGADRESLMGWWLGRLGVDSPK